MLFPIIGLSVSGLLSLVYIFIASSEKKDGWDLIARLVATMSYIFLALLAIVNLQSRFNFGHMFVILGLIFVLVADMTLEEKNRPRAGKFLMQLSSVLYVMFKLSFIAVFVYIIRSELALTNILYISLTSVGLMVLVVFFLKYIINLDLRNQTFNVLIYFSVSSLMTVLYVWYAVLIPVLWPLAVFAVLMFFNDILLINLNFENNKNRVMLYTTQRVFYYLSLVFLIYFLFFSFVNLRF